MDIVTDQDVLQVAAELLSLVAKSRGATRSLDEQRIERLERGVLAGAVRGQLGAWDLELVSPDLLAPSRALVWMAVRHVVDALGGDIRRARVSGRGVVVGARRPRPWDVVRLQLIRLPSWLDVDLVREAQEEVDAAERSPAVLGALHQLLAERRRAAVLDALRPVLAALDAGTPLSDTAERLRAAAEVMMGARAMLAPEAAA